MIKKSPRLIYRGDAKKCLQILNRYTEALKILSFQKLGTFQYKKIQICHFIVFHHIVCVSY